VIDAPMRAVYEAGPTAYGLYRRATAEGLDVPVCAPGYSERRPGDRVKTDKRDAIRLATLDKRRPTGSRSRSLALVVPVLAGEDGRAAATRSRSTASEASRLDVVENLVTADGSSEALPVGRREPGGRSPVPAPIVKGSP
jgi:transposase